jgi:thiol:disulfide interchange protein
MKTIPLVPTILFALILGSFQPAFAEDKPAAKVEPVYTVKDYDPKADPQADLQKTIERAKAQNKRILVQVGGDWCGWCKLMSKYFHENEKVASALAKDYLIMKVNFSDANKNQKFLSQFPPAQGYPHIYVLEKDGKFLHSQGTSALEEGKGYSEKAMLEFLAKWAPAKSASIVQPPSLLRVGSR